MENLIKTFELNKQSSITQIYDLGKNVYKITTDVTSEIIEVLAIDFDNKSMTIRHKHNTHDLVFKNNLDLVLDSMGIKRSQENLHADVKAPMPGKVIDVVVKEGDTIVKGDAILILEAMKMENVLKAENDCSIKKILIEPSQNVEKNQILIELDPA
ncbi:MAG: acetyl-CoA carboxylase biotin carboxyl carrier protein subunit [Crocinitomicaceae bacterium]|nr:acetyl-CoA carboxylase biotin carboxyl carrier protein subunit [Crocinitomicaceae bacterium]